MEYRGSKTLVGFLILEKMRYSNFYTSTMNRRHFQTSQRLKRRNRLRLWYTSQNQSGIYGFTAISTLLHSKETEMSWTTHPPRFADLS